MKAKPHSAAISVSYYVEEDSMSLRSGTSVKESAGNLKYGDVVLLYYTVDKKFQAAASGNQNGFILADLSG